jgi:hypothetical protein
MTSEKDKLPAISGYAHSIQKACPWEVLSWLAGARPSFRTSVDFLFRDKAVVNYVLRHGPGPRSTERFLIHTFEHVGLPTNTALL